MRRATFLGVISSLVILLAVAVTFAVILGGEIDASSIQTVCTVWLNVAIILIMRDLVERP